MQDVNAKSQVSIYTISQDISANEVDSISDLTVASNAFTEKIDTTKMKEPSFKMILTATGDYAYRRNDGIYIVPIGCLKE